MVLISQLFSEMAFDVKFHAWGCCYGCVVFAGNYLLLTDPGLRGVRMVKGYLLLIIYFSQIQIC